MAAVLESAISTTCPYCGVGCGVDGSVVHEAGRTRLVSVNGADTHPANLGRLCVKGSALHETMGAQGRLLHPMIAGCRTDWGTALDAVAAGFTEVINNHGPDAVAFYLSGQLLTEDYYVANKLMKGFIGSANVDTNSRLCMASAVAAYKRAFGADAVPCSYEDLECCDLLVITGSNAAWTHPVLYQRISAARAARPNMKVVVVDPRRTATSDIADLHLAIRPGADAFLFTGLLRHLADRKQINHNYVQAHTRGFDEALAVTPDLEQTTRLTGLATEDLQQFYDWFARTERTITFYSQGINQSATGTDKCNAIINCHLATGRIGKPGTGPFSITGQPNAMGGREVGGLANQLAAHMDFTPDNVDRMKRFWHTKNVASKPGLKAVDMFQAMEQGRIKAVWIMATNPAVSLPEAARVRKALAACDLVVVSDCIQHTDTTALADILLPASGWGEKDGTVTNSERRISRQRALVRPEGEARSDWWIVSEVARRMGHAAAFDYPDAASIFREHAALSAFENGDSDSVPRCFDISALADISDQDYDSLQPIQWPVNTDYPNGRQRLFENGQYHTPDRKARFVPVLPDNVESDLPFVLNTGRLRDQWHTMTRTGRAPRLLQHTDAPRLAMSERDAWSRGLSAGDLVQLRNSHGALLVSLTVDPGLRDGELFMPIHWNAQFASHGCVDDLVPAITDPHSGQPQSKLVPVDLVPVRVQQWMQVISPHELDMSGIDYWVKTPVDGGFRYHCAVVNHKPDMVALEQRWTGNSVLQRIAFANDGKGEYRAIHCTDTHVELGIFTARHHSELPAGDSLLAVLLHEPGDESWRLIAGLDLAGTGSDRTVCSCHQVRTSQILAAIELGDRDHEALGRRLRCGTNCGSCIPELKQLLAQNR